MLVCGGWRWEALGVWWQVRYRFMYLRECVLVCCFVDGWVSGRSSYAYVPVGFRCVRVGFPWLVLRVTGWCVHVFLSGRLSM